jgi:hypothetical protein
MMTFNQHLRVHPEVVDTPLKDQETVLLHLHSKLYYSLNATGTRIWQGLKQGLTHAEISQRLQAEFTVDAERADRSVLSLVNELCEHQLVVSNDVA